ncbi:MAG: GNAT family N-acetyltransferase [Solirubrobacteraceae bacterium]
MLIETERLVLRRLAMGDLDEFVVLHRDPEVVRFVGALDRTQAKERLQASEREWGARGHGLLAVLDRSSGRLLGRVGLRYWPQFREIEAGWLLRREAWGHGYATEAVRACVDWGFATLPVPYITAMIHPENTRSTRVAQRLGFEPVREDVLLGDPVIVHTLERESWASLDPTAGTRPCSLRVQLPTGQWLRLLEESDAQELYSVIEANRDRLARWMPWAAGQTLDDTLVFIRDTREQLARNDGFQTAVIDDGRIVGVVGFHGISWQHRSTSIGYWLADSAQGHGTMTQAVRALVDHAFGTWRLHRVEIRAGVDNMRSRAIAERLGFTQEGVAHEAERVGGRYVDQVVYAIRDEPAVGNGSRE